MSRAVVAALLALALAACASPRPSDAQRATWTRDWNERLDAATTDFQHPCATKPFIAWADAFLAGCQPDAAAAPAADCGARNQWVRERVEQCREWTAWQLRNFGGHERIGGDPPSMRVE